MKELNRPAVIGALLLTLLAMGLPSRAAINPKEFRIGYQKAANTLVLLKAHGTLEQRLRPLGVQVTWLEFTAGPQLLAGLNVGAIDFGYVGEVPPIFALAAGANLVYTAYVPRCWWRPPKRCRTEDTVGSGGHGGFLGVADDAGTRFHRQTTRMWHRTKT